MSLRTGEIKRNKMAREQEKKDLKRKEKKKQKQKANDPPWS